MVKKIVSVVIGTSTGGISALHEILPEFTKTNTCSILIAMHILSPGVIDTLIKKLDEKCSLDVKGAYHGMPLEPGTACFIPCDFHGEIKNLAGDAIISLNQKPKINFVRPSIDLLMKSVAQVYKQNTIGVLLTGMGMDGSEGLKAIKDSGGATIVQDETTSSVFAMPKSAINLNCVDEVLPLNRIPEKVQTLINEKSLNLAV